MNHVKCMLLCILFFFLITVGISANLTLNNQPLPQLNAHPQLIWKKSSPLIFREAPMVGDDGNIYVNANLDSNNSIRGPVCVDPNTMKIIWGPTSYTCAIGAHSMTSNGIIYSIGDWNSCNDGLLLAHLNGEMLWVKRSKDEGYSPHPRMTPAIDELNHSVYWGATYLYQVDIHSGDTIWKKNTVGGLRISNSSAIDSMGNVYYTTYDNYSYSKVRAFDKTGVLKWGWDSPVNGDYGIVGVNSKDQVIIGQKTSQKTFGVDTNGNIIWEYSETISVGSIDKNDNIFGTSGNHIIALDKNGSLIWRKDFAEWVAVDFIGNDGNLYVRTKNAVLSINSIDGSINWSFFPGVELDISVELILVTGGNLFFTDVNHDFYLL